jgi:hypothetical protein
VAARYPKAIEDQYPVVAPAASAVGHIRRNAFAFEGASQGWSHMVGEHLGDVLAGL